MSVGGREVGGCRVISELAVRRVFVGTLMLLHVVFAGEGLVAGWANHRFFSRVFFAVAGSVAGSSEGVGATEASGVRAREFLFGGAR